MRRRPLALAAILGGAALLVALFFILRPAGEEQTAPATQPPGANETTTATAPEPEPTETEPEVEPEVPTLRVTVVDGRPSGGIGRLTVPRGVAVRIVVRADVSDHVHVHGYDLMRNVGPGRPAQFAFEATIPGRFEVELEDRRLLIAELEVTP